MAQLTWRGDPNQVGDRRGRANRRAASPRLQHRVWQPDAGASGARGAASRVVGFGHHASWLGGDPAVGIALVTLRTNVWFDGPVALLDELYVAPDSRGKGIGSAMIAALLAKARDDGWGLVEINVDEFDHDARRFYERHGFTATEPASDERPVLLSRAVGTYFDLTYPEMDDVVPAPAQFTGTTLKR